MRFLSRSYEPATVREQAHQPSFCFLHGQSSLHCRDVKSTTLHIIWPGLNFLNLLRCTNAYCTATHLPSHLLASYITYAGRLGTRHPFNPCALRVRLQCHCVTEIGLQLTLSLSIHVPLRLQRCWRSPKQHTQATLSAQHMAHQIVCMWLNTEYSHNFEWPASLSVFVPVIGAFLVTASWNGQHVNSPVHIKSEAGAACSIENPFAPAKLCLSEEGAAHIATTATAGIVAFKTDIGRTYILTRC